MTSQTKTEEGKLVNTYFMSSGGGEGTELSASAWILYR